jgi:hypothetical protein
MKIKKPFLKNYNRNLVIELFLIIFSLSVIILGVYFGMDFKKANDRDKERMNMVIGIQEALEEFYLVHGYYPGNPNKETVYTDWKSLVTHPEMKAFFNFGDFKDPCSPTQTLSINGTVSCNSKKIAYEYLGINCDVNCRGYKIILWLETGGRKEFIPK